MTTATVGDCRLSTVFLVNSAGPACEDPHSLGWILVDRHLAVAESVLGFSMILREFKRRY